MFKKIPYYVYLAGLAGTTAIYLFTPSFVTRKINGTKKVPANGWQTQRVVVCCFFSIQN